MMQPLTDDEEKAIEKHCRKIMAGKPLLALQIFTVILAKENGKLAKEVNRLRALAGEPLIKTYTPGVNNHD